MKITNVAFKGKIIDSHAHTGRWSNKVCSSEQLDEFIKQPFSINNENDTVEKMLVSNLSCINPEARLDELVGNEQMLEVCKNNQKLIPLAVCQPNLTDGNPVLIEELLAKYNGKFVGLKFHPKVLELRADAKEYDKYLDIASKHKLPCLFHSQVSLSEAIETSDPRYIYNLAKRHPDVPVILGHLGAGGEIAHKKAIDILLESLDKKDAKLYADISWVDWENDLPSQKKKSVVALITELKKRNATDRILFGTDAPLGCYGESPIKNISPRQAYEQTIKNLKNCIKDNFPDDSEYLIDKIFYKNADNLFFKKEWVKELTQKVDENISNSNIALFKTSLKKIAPIVLGIVAIAGVVATMLKNKKTKLLQQPVVTGHRNIYTNKTFNNSSPIFDKITKNVV